MTEQRIDITSISLETIIAMNGTDFDASKIKEINENTTGVYIFYQIWPIQQIWYVGASQNLRERIKHHTFAKFFKLLMKGGCSIKITFIEFSDQTKEGLNAIESVFINRLNPLLNLQHNQFLRQLKSVKVGIDYQVESSSIPSPAAKTTLSIVSRRGVQEQKSVSRLDSDNIRQVLENSTIRELKKIASSCDVIGYSNMTKLELAIAIKESGRLMDDRLLKLSSEPF